MLHANLQLDRHTCGARSVSAADCTDVTALQFRVSQYFRDAGIFYHLQLSKRKHGFLFNT